MAAQPASLLATRRGRLLLLLLCAVQFLDVADSSIMNVALPSIRRDLGFSAQGLQWVLSGGLAAGAGMLVYALVRAPEQGWGSARTTGELATAAALLAAFTATELRRRDPLFPFTVFRVKGLAASDAVQMIAFAAFVSVFYFLTLDMQNVLGFSPVRSGSAYLPVTAGIIVAAGISSRLFARTGARPVIVAGALTAAAGVWYLSRNLPAIHVPLIGLAIFSAIATARTSTLLAAHAPADAALTAGFHRALLACAFFLLAAAVIALRAANSRGEPVTEPSGTPAAPGQVPAPELAD